MNERNIIGSENKNAESLLSRKSYNYSNKQKTSSQNLAEHTERKYYFCSIKTKKDYSWAIKREKTYTKIIN